MADEQERKNSAPVGLGAIIRGVADLVEKLGDLAEKGESFSRSGEVRAGRAGNEARGVYGVSVKFGLGGEGAGAGTFEGVPQGRSRVDATREPLVDVFEEADHTLIVAEMPGVRAEDVEVELRGRVLTLSAVRGEKAYRKAVGLSESHDPEKVRVFCNNGIVEIRCEK